MHKTAPGKWEHSHDFIPASHRRGERQTRIVIALTAVMMVAEIAAGTAFNSMALLADGWHMASHASALSITAFAYFYARRNANNLRYSFGTWKVSVLGGFSSAVVLAVISIMIAWESVGRFFEPLSIRFDEAILVACVGLAVNLLSVYLLKDEPHEHSHSHAGHDHHEHHDHNRRAAYLHVLADTLTSGTAIFALLTGKFYGWVWMDPLMGVVGSVVIARWSYGLLRDTSRVLLDGDVDTDFVEEVRQTLEENSDDWVSDLHIWRVGPGKLAAIVSIVSHHPKPPEHYKKLLGVRSEIVHASVEVNPYTSYEQDQSPQDNPSSGL